MKRLPVLLQRLAQGARLMVGLPDYQRYVEHMQSRHPDAPRLSHAEFMHEMQQRRYAGKSSSRCC